MYRKFLGVFLFLMVVAFSLCSSADAALKAREPFPDFEPIKVEDPKYQPQYQLEFQVNSDNTKLLRVWLVDCGTGKVIKSIKKTGSDPIIVKKIPGLTVFAVPPGIEVDSDSRYAKAVNGAKASEFTYNGKKGLKFRGGDTIFWTATSDMSVWNID